MKKLIEFVVVMLLLSSIFCGVMVGVIKVVYPIGYSFEIGQYSKLYNLETSLVRAIIKEESGYNALAKSKAGARGLMQIMPDTAQWIAGEIGLSNFDADMLFDPTININIGCYYLNYLTTKYENLHKVLFAYNAGEGVLNSMYDKNQPLVIETIEITETKNYIMRVQKTKRVYEGLESV